MIKSAQVYFPVAEFVCPYCDEYLAHPETGSHMWPIGEDIPKEVKCFGCDNVVKIGSTANRKIDEQRRRYNQIGRRPS